MTLEAPHAQHFTPLMKLIKAVLPLFLLSLAWGQGVRFGDGNPPMTTHSIFGVPNLLQAEPNAIISVCGAVANGVPCTNKVTTYTSSTLGTACPTSTQITRGNSTTCVGTTDASGNWGVWVPAGLYTYTITYKGASVGPIFFTAGASSGGGAGAWGSITGTLSAQADLQAALDLKATVAALATKAPLVHTHDAGTDIVSGILSPSRLPPPTANTLGGVEGNGTNLTCDTGFVSNGFDSSGHINCVLDQTGGGSYVLPALQASTLGGVKGNGGLTCSANNHLNGFASDGTINCTADPVISVATRTGAIVLGEADITNLITDLAGKAPSSHTHTEAQVTNLVTDLAGKAALVHTHSESDVTNLVNDLAARALDSNTVHKTGTETVGGQKTFSNVPLILTLANGCLNITAGLIGTTGSACGAGGGGTWGSITGTLSNQTDLQNALNLKANESAVVHNTGPETISGIKEWANDALFDGILQVAGGYEVTSDWPAGAMTAPGVNQTKIGIDSDGHFKTCEGTAPCVAAAIDSAAVHNTGTESVGGVKTFTSGVKISGLSDGCLNIAAQVVGSQACASGGGYTNLFQTSVDILTQRRGANTQLWQLMDSYTDASNYQGMEVSGQGIHTTWLGTGSSMAYQFGIKTGAGAIRGWQISTGQDLLPWNNTAPPNIASSGARMGTIFATVFNTPLADGCVEIASNVMGTRSNPCAVTPNEITVRTYAAGGGTAQAQTITLSPAATSLQNGLTVRWLPTAANSGGGPTLAVNGLTATTIKKCGTTALAANDLNTTTIAQATYDGSAFELMNPQVGACGTLSAGVADPGSNGVVVRTGAGTAAARTITGGAGIAVTNGDGTGGNPNIATDSTKNDFIASGALTCGSGQQGKAKVHTTPLQYCDNAATPALQYSAYGASNGDALIADSGDSATAFFTTGQIEAARGGTGGDSSGSTGIAKVVAGAWSYVTALPSTTTATSPAINDNSTSVATTLYADREVASGTQTLTNKTVDAEGTGNTVTLPFKVWLAAAGCNNATASTFWDLPASTPAVATCVTGSNTQKGVLAYADTSGGFSAQNELLLPADFSGNIDARIIWSTSATSGNAKWSLSTICTDVAATATDDPAFNTASTVTTAAPGTANRLQTSSISGLTITGCLGGNFLHLKAFRDGNDGSDTIGATANLVGVELTIRRAM